jgi:hypothetical protein
LQCSGIPLHHHVIAHTGLAIGTVPPSYLGPSNLCESPILAAD